MSGSPEKGREREPLTLTVGRPSTKTKTREEAAGEEASQSKVGQLFDRLGGKGKLRIYRIVDGEERYSKILDVDDNLSENLEETVAKLCGGGTFILRGFHRIDAGQTKCVGVATMHIDELVHAPRQTEREKQRDGDRGQPAIADTTKEIVAMLRDQVRQTRDDAASKEQGTNGMFAQMMQLQSQQAAQTAQMQIEASKASQQTMMTLFGLFMQQKAGGGGGLGLEQLGQARTFLEGMGFAPAGSKAEDTRSFGERLIEAPLARMADRIGDRVGGVVANMVAEENRPASSPAPAPVQQPQLQQPQQQPQPQQQQPPAPPRPAPGAVVKLPPGARPLTDEQLEAMRKSGQMKRPPAAPRATDVLPSDKDK